MILGPAIVAVGAAFLSIFGNQPGYLVHFLPALLLVGAGMALVIAPLTKSALMVESKFSGSASGVNNAVARFAALMAIAILSAVMLITFTSRLNSAIDTSTLSQTQQQQILSQANKLGGIAVPSDFSDTAKTSAETAISGSFLYGYRWAMGICALLAAGASVVASVTIHNPKVNTTNKRIGERELI